MNSTDSHCRRWADVCDGIFDACDTDWRDMTETKLPAMSRFCQAAIAHMRETALGRIINMSSMTVSPNHKLPIARKGENENV
jgi:NADP-dependent 3-hydroxy acid dehydrogenase YdfG